MESPLLGQNQANIEQFFDKGANPVYRIRWKSGYTGFAGHGDWFDNKDTLTPCIDAMNKKYPNIQHWLERK